MSRTGRTAVGRAQRWLRVASFCGLAALLPILVLGPLPARGAGDPVIFSALGDVPYSADEILDLQQHIADHDRFSPSAFLVHLGDIKKGTDACAESQYSTIADILKASEVPVFIVPGDNEWVDCSNPDQGWAWWEEHLLGLEQSFCGIWPVDAQSAHPENFAFVRDGVLFIGLNHVSGAPSSAVQAAADWVNAQFAAYAATARAVVLMAQAEPTGSLLDAVVSRGGAFAKPVLYIHGDGHEWLEDPVFFGASNMLRVQVARGTLANPPVQVTVASNGTFSFDRDPWPPGTSESVRPPCGAPALSIDDLFVGEGQNAVFTVTLAGATGSAVSVGYATQDGTARAGEDYSARSGTLSFSGSTTQRQVSVPVSQDTTVESGESFFVNLANATGASIARAQGAAVILDDDSPPPSGGPVLREVATGGSTSSNAVATSGPVGAGSGDLYLAAVSFKPNVAVASVTGLGLAWTPVSAQCAGRAQTGVALFRAQGTPTAGGVVSASLSATPSAAVISVARYSGASSSGGIGSVVSANSNGVSGACSNGTDSVAYAFDLASGASNSLVFVAAAMRNRDHVPGTGFSEIAETYAGSSGSVAGESLAERTLSSPASVSVNGSFGSTVDWAVVAAEVRAGSTTSSPVTLSVTTVGGGSVSLSPPGGSYPAGTSVTLTATPDAGYGFAGWSGGLTGTATPATLVLNARTSVTASFRRLYTVTVSPSTGGSVSLSPSGGVYLSGTTVTATATPASGYAFSGWSGALGGTQNPTTLLVDADKTIAASFTPQVSVSVTTTGNGSVSLSPSGGSYAPGTLVTLTAVPGTGASFLGWGGALSGTQNPTTLLVDTDKTVTASFTAAYTLTVSTKGKGSVSLSPPGGAYAADTLVTLTAVPGSGFTFVGWSGDVTGTSTTVTVVMDRNKTVLASFRKAR